MMRIALMVATALSCVTFAADTQNAAHKSEALMQGEGINLRMFSSRPTFGETEDPTFWVHAERGHLLEDPRVWTLEQAHAVIYRDPEEDIVLVAKIGTVDENSKAAHLDGGVHVTSGSFVAELENIRWDDETGVARSDATARLDDGVNRLVGESIALYADEDRFELGQGSARIQLAAEATDETEADPKASEFESIEIPMHKGIGGNIDGRLREIRGPAHLILSGVDPANTLSIKADHVSFQYGEGEDNKMPEKILLKGHIELIHSAATFRSNEATIDLVGRTARFEGDVVMAGEQIEGANGEFFELNLDTGDWFLGGESNVEKVWLIAPKKAEKPADPKQ
jgi:hypothetical protein